MWLIVNTIKVLRKQFVMKKINILRLVTVAFCGLMIIASVASCRKKDEEDTDKVPTIKTKAPSYLKAGDKIALISPAYYTSDENVQKAAAVIRSWGFEPVIGPNVGKKYAGQYAGTVEERLSDIRWALKDPDIKAIICNRGGYGTIQLIDKLKKADFTKRPTWIVGFSDITTLHEMSTCAGLMSIHGTMGTFLAASEGKDTSSIVMRDMLLGKIPRYIMPANEHNINGSATGTLVGGNLMTFAPVVGSSADALKYDSIILFIEEVEESMHNIDRQVNMLQKSGVMDRVKGVILGEFTDCGHEFDYSTEEMLSKFFAQFDIPVICGFPAGHGDINMPLIMGATCVLDVRSKGAGIAFKVDGESYDIYTSGLEPKVKTPLQKRLQMAGKVE